MLDNLGAFAPVAEFLLVPASVRVVLKRAASETTKERMGICQRSRKHKELNTGFKNP